MQSAAGISSHLPEPNEPAFQPVQPVSQGGHRQARRPERAGLLRQAKGDQRLRRAGQAIWQEFERYWLQEQFYGVPIAGNLAHIPYRSWVKGRLHPPEQIMSYLDFATVWLDK